MSKQADMAGDGAHNPSRLIASAHALVDVSGPEILRYFRQTLVVENKAEGGGFDPVTVADRGAEKLIREELARRHPEHGVLGEEMGERRSASAYTWVIDPIDGTRAFVTGMPLWGTLIGLTHEGRAVLGLMDQPFMQERIWSEDGAATYWRTAGGDCRRIGTSTCERLADARLVTTTPDMFAEGEEQAAFGRLKAAARMTRYGGDCYSYCLLAAGHIDVIAEAGLQPYDVVALIAIIEGAGGVVSTWSGGRPEGGGRIVAAATRRLHEAALQALAMR